MAGLKRGFWTRPSRGMTVSVWTECARRFDVLQSCPAHLKGRLREAARLALDARHQAASVEDAMKETHAWSILFVALLVAAPLVNVESAKLNRSKRFDQFGEGQWTALHRMQKGMCLLPVASTPEGESGGTASWRGVKSAPMTDRGSVGTWRRNDFPRPAKDGVCRFPRPTVCDFERDIPVDLGKHVSGEPQNCTSTKKRFPGDTKGRETIKRTQKTHKQRDKKRKT